MLHVGTKRERVADGTEDDYEGEKDAERRVRTEFPSGNVHYYEGEGGVGVGFWSVLGA